MSAPSVKLTKRQAAALRHVAGGGCEGDLHDLYPLIRQPRLVVIALKRKGLLTFGDWDDGPGYELYLTDAGHAVLEASQ